MSHLAWIGKRFEEVVPNPLPSLIIEDTIMHQTHALFGRTQTGPISYGFHWVPVLTSHWIRGIIDNQLHLEDVLLMHIRMGSRETRQMVYVSNNTSYFYLSEAFLKDLHLLSPDSPAPISRWKSQRKMPCSHSNPENPFQRWLIPSRTFRQKPTGNYWNNGYVTNSSPAHLIHTNTNL